MTFLVDAKKKTPRNLDIFSQKTDNYFCVPDSVVNIRFCWFYFLFWWSPGWPAPKIDFIIKFAKLDKTQTFLAVQRDTIYKITKNAKLYVGWFLALGEARFINKFAKLNKTWSFLAVQRDTIYKIIKNAKLKVDF